MDYEFGPLGSRQFEHLTQALLFAIYGARSTAHGDGPDRGRDGSIRGLMAAPGKGNHDWNGYVVAQAKFHERRGTPAQEAAWFLSELNDELSLWKSPKAGKYRTGDKPDYLLFVTNVTLSPAENGGQARVEQKLTEFAEEFGLKGFAVWSYASLCRLIDGQADIRRTYLGYIAPGDILATLLAGLEEDNSDDLGALLMTHLAKDMVGSNAIRVGNVGPVGNVRVELDDVAIDLPSRLIGADPSEGGAVARIIAHCDLPATQLRSTLAGRLHFVVVGGPGQGKTTVTTMVAQAYRVAMLQSATDLSDVATQVRDATSAHFDDIGIPVPRLRRFPFRINLATYAERLSASGNISLLRWIAEEVSARSDSRVSPARLKSMLYQWPWLLVLDGLDEVAAVLVRDAIVRNITDFLQEVASGNWDTILVCTTRPMGYDGSLSPDAFRELRLEAMRYQESIDLATRLATKRVGSNESELREVLGRIQSALKATVTSRLMRSPLQVTIMTLLLEAHPRPPRDRASLFETYFQVIYTREAEKLGFLADLLDESRQHVFAIHDLVALRLQMDAESAKDSDSVMTVADFQDVVVSYLVDVGYAHAVASEMSEKYVRAAMERLVLLVPKGANGIGFEVRSLQEYLAARHLANGPDDVVLRRLRSAASSAYWRNTWLLAAGRSLQTRPYLGRDLAALPAEIDNTETAGALGLPGVAIAVGMLEDNLASSVPTIRRELASHAVTAFNYPPVALSPLASVLNQESVEEQESPVIAAFDEAMDAGGGRRASAVMAARELRSDSIGPLAARGRQRAQLPQPDVYDVGLPSRTLDEVLRLELSSVQLDEDARRVVDRFLSALRGIKLSPFGDGFVPGLPEPDAHSMAVLGNPQASEAIYLAVTLTSALDWQEESAIRRVLANAVMRRPISTELAALEPSRGLV